MDWARDLDYQPPGAPANPMQGVKIYFQAPYYFIHGTNDPESIGEAASHGCIRMTARDAVQSRIAGLDSGADDYLTKPFDFNELLARLRAVIRRGVRPPIPDRLRAGSIELDTRSREVTKAGQRLRLTAREYSLIEYFVRHPHHVIGRAEIAEHVWDESYDPFSNVIDVYVQRLRRKIDDPDTESLIRTRRGEGYAFVPRAE